MDDDDDGTKLDRFCHRDVTLFIPQPGRTILPCALLFALVAPSWAQTGPPVIFAQSTYSVTESAGVVTATVRLADDRLGGNFSVTGTVVALDDVTVAFANELDRIPTQFNYDMSTSPVTFRLDQTATQAEVTIPIIADPIPESEESIPLQLLSFGHADSTQKATVVITDDDRIVIGFDSSDYSVREYTVREGGSVCVGIAAPPETVAIELPDIELEVNTMPGTADTDRDFRPINRQSAGPFRSATRKQCFAYEVINDSVPEEDESFTLELTFASGPREKVVIATETATVVITNDDIGIGFERTSYALDEGDSLPVCIAMTTPTAMALAGREFSLAVSTRPGTAGINDFINFGDFFNPDPKVFTFGDSTRSACFNFETIEDAIAEDEERMFLDLTARLSPGESLDWVSINPAVTEVMIADNDPITIGFETAEATVVEGRDTTATVCVEITGPATIERADFSLSLRATDGSATLGADYSAPTTPTLGPFGSGGRRGCSDVGIIDDEVAESSETFRMAVATSGSPVGVIVAPSSLTVTITDDDVLIDYSSDGRLIDVSNIEQLHAMRWDLEGNGVPDPAHATSYTAAFPDAARNMGCDATCQGYALANDIDLGASRFGHGRSSEGWQPIAGRPTNNFRQTTSYDGDFDGRGHAITGLYINRPTSDHVGLFGRIGERNPSVEGRIQNLGLLDADVTGRNWVGALAGQISTNTIVTTIYVSGGSVTGDNYVGGLAGRVEDDLIAVYASVAVSGTNSVGGLAGTYYGFGNKELTASYAAGRVTGTTNAGGLVGNRENRDNTTVNDSYWDTLASGQSASALGVGYDTAALQTPTTYSGIYADWNVDVDGIAGADDPWVFGGRDDYPALRGSDNSVFRQLLRSSRIVISVTGTATVAEGGAAMYTVVASQVLPYRLMVHWDVGKPATATGLADSAATAEDFRADARATMALAAFPTGTAIIRAGGSEATFSVYVFDDDAEEDPESFQVGVRVGDLGGRISVAEASSAVITVIELSDSTDYDDDNDNLIGVTTTAQLAAIRHDLTGSGIAGVSEENEEAYRAAFPSYDRAATCPGTCAGYELLNDVDLTGMNWIPIGGGDDERPFPDEPPAATQYSGRFEGNGYVISNMRISSVPRYDHVGLFGALSATGTIRSVGLVDVDIDVRRGSLSGARSRNTGGLVGVCYGTIAASYVVRGSVRGDFTVGGLAGALRRSGSVIASYADVSVQAIDTIGGLAGFADQASVTVSASYTTGRVQAGGGASQVGGLIGITDRFNRARIQRSYFDSDRSGRSSCCGAGGPMPDETSKTSHQLRIPTMAAGIYDGWDRLDVDGDSVADSPWDFGTEFDYPVLVFGFGDDAERRAARRTSQQETQPTVDLTPTLGGGATVSEGVTASYVVRLPLVLPPGIGASWSWSVSGGTVGDADFAGTSKGSVVVASGASSASFPLAVADNDGPENAEAFEVSLDNALLTGAPDDVILGVTGAVVRTTIAANGVRLATVTAAPETLAEGATATFTVQLGAGAGDDAVTVDYEIAAASAGLTPADLRSVTVSDRSGVTSVQVIALPVGGSVTLGAGDIARVSVQVADGDAPREGSERFRLRLTGCRNCGPLAAIGAPDAAEVNILDQNFVVSAHAYLQGAYAGGGRMRTRLIEYLPASSPYGTAPWNAPRITVPGMNAGDFGLSGVTDTVVDWVLVELRKTPQGAGGVAAVTPLTSQAALLLGDGTIVGVDGLNGAALRTEGVFFGADVDDASEDLYVLIRHRNHLSAMARATTAACAADYCADLRFQPSYLNCQARLGGGRYAMFAGDTDRDNDVDSADEAAIRIANLETIGARHYRAAGGGYAIDADLDFDGEVLSADRRYIIVNTSGGTQARSCAFR